LTDFKAGDKVEILKTNWRGKTGKVISTEYSSVWPYRVRIDGGESSVFHANELKLVKPEPKFKIGDWVKVTGRNDKWDGTVGTVQKFKDPSYSKYTLYTIHKNDVGDDVKKSISGNVLGFFEDNLVATDAPKSKYAKGGVILHPYTAADTRLTAKVLGYFDGGKVSDPVNGPSHYGGADNPYEVIKVAEAWGLDKDAYLFNVLKYIARAGKKHNRLEDLKKGGYYLNRRITREEAK
jgi:hypothetical protein